MKAIVDLFKETFNEWSEDNCLQLGASLAYYALFSLFPLLLLIITLIGFLLGDSQNTTPAECAASGSQETTCQILGSVSSTVSPQVGELVGTTITSMQENSAAGGISAIIGFVTLLLGASGVFGQLDAAFNIIWNVKKPEVQGGIKEKVLAAIKDKSLAFTMVMGTVFLLLISMVLSSVITGLGAALEGRLPGGEFVWQAVQTLVSVGLVAVAFAAIFRLLPDTHVEWRDVWWGALLTSVLFAVLKQLLSWYIGNSGSFAAYGLVGAVLALLTWIYFTSQILFFGGEFTQVYARHYGSRVGQTEDAASPATDVQSVAPQKPTPAPVAKPTQQQEELRRQRYAFAVGGLAAGVIGTVIAAVVGSIVGIVKGVMGLRRGGRTR